MSLTFPTTPNNRLGLRLHSVSLARFSFRSTSQRWIATAEEQQHSSGSNWAVEWTRQAVTTNRAKCLPGQTTFFQQSNRTRFSCFFSAALAGIDGHWWWRDDPWGCSAALSMGMREDGVCQLGFLMGHTHFGWCDISFGRSVAPYVNFLELNLARRDHSQR